MHTRCADASTLRTPTALFVALTRSVREAAVTDAVRHEAYDLIYRMADRLRKPEFEVELEALMAFSHRHPGLRTALQPLRDELRALATP